MVGSLLFSLEKKKKAHLVALQKSEESLSITLNSIGDAVIATDIRGCVTRMNPIAEVLTGWSEADALSLPLDQIFSIINALSREKTENPVEKVLFGGMVVGLANHTVLIARDGTEYQIADSAAPIRNSAGEVNGVVLVFRDVTEEYAQEERLRQSEEKYRTFFENLADAMLMIENEEFTDCNNATVAMLGYDRKEEVIHARPAQLSPEFQSDGRLSLEKAGEMMRLT